MPSLNDKIDTWIFDLDNTLYSADCGIFQQVHDLMGKFVSKHLNVEIKKANEIQRKYYKQHGTTLRGMMDNHGVDPEYFLKEVHKLDYSIVDSNKKLNEELKKLKGRKIVYTNANLQHALDVLDRIELSNFFDNIFDIKMAKYIPKPELQPYEPAKKVGFTSIWIDAGYENFSDDIKASKEYLDFKTKDLSVFLEKVNRRNI